MDFPRGCLPLPKRGFPFKVPFRKLPVLLPDCHLDRTAILCLPFYDSLGVFHCSLAGSYPLLQKIFQETILSPPWPRRRKLNPYPQIPLKAGYSAHSVRQPRPLTHRITGLILLRTEVVLPIGVRPARGQVSTPTGSGFLCH